MVPGLNSFGNYIPFQRWIEVLQDFESACHSGPDILHDIADKTTVWS